MNDKKNTVSYIIIGIIVLLFIVSFTYLYNKENKSTLTDYYQEIKDYKVNEYIPVYVSDNDMAKIYLNDFITLAISNPEESYYKLDAKYRDIKYPTYESYYNNFIVNIEYPKIKQFYKESIKGYLVFGVYDANDNIYIFKTKGVMQYSVYLDDYTVEIGD